MDKDSLMELKKKIVYFYFIQKQLKIPAKNKYVFNLQSNVVELFEKKKQDKKKYKYDNDLNYTLFTSSVNRIQKLHLESFDSFRFVFIDGIYHYDSKIPFNFSSFSKFDIKRKNSSLRNEIFFSLEGVSLYVPDGMYVEKPIELLYISTGKNTKNILFNTRNFIILGKGSCVKIIERYINLSLCKEKFSYVTEIYMYTNSYLDFCKIKDDKPTTYFFDHTCILQEDRSECNINTFSFCVESIINYLSIFQLGEEIHSHINGLSILQGHINHNTLIEHLYPNGKSRDVYKGIFNKMANTNFNGKIIVNKQAKKTNSSQRSVNFLLTNEAKINANPQLEIFADDVKCSHECIIGQLNTQEIFYLRSRGIPRAEAITKLLFAFAEEILECLSFKRLNKLISKKINKNVNFIRN